MTAADAPPAGAARLALALAAVLAATFAMAVCAPLRAISGDTVPGRLGAAVLRCGGGFDLRAVDWIAERAAANRLPYWARRAPRSGEIVSVFGPAPALLGAIAMPALGDPGVGAMVDDAMLRRHERFAAAALLAISAVLLALATAARRGPITAACTGLLGAASYAGAATLGQGLWQQTAALPLLVGALAALAWRSRAPRAAILAPALLVLGVLIRPTFAPLAAGLAIAWWLDRSAGRGGRRRTAVALGAAALAALPLVAWNLIELGSVLQTGQLEANARVSQHVFAVRPGPLGYGLGGLLLSPGRGWLWFAPIAVLGTIAALRRGRPAERAIAAGIAAQILVVSAFHMWWGGICFGPRFLAEATWIGIWLALGGASPSPRGWRRGLAAVAIALTIAVGQLGLWGWRAEQWETRRNPDVDQNALWDPVDSPVVAILVAAASDQPIAVDALEEAPRMICRGGRLLRR